MRTPSDASPSLGGPSGRARRRTPWILLVLSLAALVALALPVGGLAEPQTGAPTGTPGAPAGTQPGAQTGTPAGDSRELRQAIESRYEVLPLREGVLLKPRQERLGVRTLELSGNAVAVNGERVSTGVLRAWLGEDADPVLRLAALPAAERRSLFGLSAPAEVPAGSEISPPAPPPAPTEPLPGGLAVPPVPPLPVPPSPPSSTVSTGTRVRVVGSVTVEPDEIAEDVVVVGGPATIKGQVQGDVVAVGGPVWVDGKVGGDVVSVGGSVHLGPKSEVMGEVTSVWGSVHRAAGARTHGKIAEVSGVGPAGTVDWKDHRRIGHWPVSGARRLFGEMVWVILFALLLCLTYLVATRRVERAQARIAVEPWKAGLVGLLSVVAFAPLVFVATLLTCCLAVLLYPFLALAVLAVVFLGSTAVALHVGRWSEGRFGWHLGGAYVALLIGHLLLQVLTLIGRFLDIGGGMLDVFAMMFLVGGAIVHITAFFIGIGAVLLDLYDDRIQRGRAYETPVVPPPPPPAEPPPPPPILPGEVV